MDRFVTVQIKLIQTETEELYKDMGMEDPSAIFVDFHFKPEEVIAYREDPPTDESPAEGVVFSLPNEEYYTEMTEKDFEKLIGADR